MQCLGSVKQALSAALDADENKARTTGTMIIEDEPPLDLRTIEGEGRKRNTFRV